MIGRVSLLAFVLGALVTVGVQPVGAQGAAAFPVTIEHKYGSTTIPARPKRVVTVGFNEQDFTLAVGVVPVGVREWLGDFPFQERPWAKEQLGGVELPTVGAIELDIERIAALQPDLILALYAGLTPSEYETLSRIAPTIVQPAEYGDWGIPWDVQMLITGRALGREEEAQRLVDGVRAQYASARAANPSFKGKTAAFVSFNSNGFLIYPEDDIRTQFLTWLGFNLPEETGSFSQERAKLLDVDVLVAVASPDVLENDPIYGTLNVVREGRVVYLDGWTDPLAAAIGFNSPLSLQFLLEQIVPRLAAAIDRGAVRGAQDNEERSAAFPVQIEHKLGVTVIPKEPERVITVGLVHGALAFSTVLSIPYALDDLARSPGAPFGRGARTRPGLKSASGSTSGMSLTGSGTRMLSTPKTSRSSSGEKTC